MSNYVQGLEPNLADIYFAQRQIKGRVTKTPLVKSANLSEMLGSAIYLKLENLQVTGSFKIRGATNKILNLSDDERARGVIAVSSGNHGKAVAYTARANDIQAVICMSETVPANKVKAIRELGAEAILAGSTYDEAAEVALRLQAERGLTMIHPFDDPLVIAGQGTIGLELIEEKPEIDSVIVPLSGGGLLGGIAIALKSIKPEVRTIGVSMERGPAMAASLKAGHVVEVIEEPSMADALMGGLGGENKYTFQIMQNLVDQTVLVSEEEIAAAMTYALEKEQQVVEGGGAVGIAALLAGKVKTLGEHVAVVVSGGNVDMSTLIDVAQGDYPYRHFA